MKVQEGRVSRWQWRVPALLRGVVMAMVLCWSLGMMAAASKEDVDAYNTMADLIHNRTYDLNNLAVADSIYGKAKQRGSKLAMMYALRIKFYAYVGNDKTEGFLSSVDEYLGLAEGDDFVEEYFEGVSAKIQYLMTKGEYTQCMFLARDMLKKAEESKSALGLYESNLLLGQIYKYRGNHLTALSYFEHSMEHTDDTDSVGRSIINRDMAECYSSLGQGDIAVQKAREARKWANYDVYRYFSEWSLLSVLYNDNKMQEFKTEYRKSLLHNADVTGILSADMLYELRCMLLVSEGRFAESRALADSISLRQSQLAHIALSYFYENDFKNAYQAQKELVIVTDSTMAGIQQSELVRYDAELGNATLRYEAEKATARMRLIVSLCIGAVLVLVIGGMTYVLLRRQRENRRLFLSREETRQALEKAEKANAMRLHFIQNMSHEIRTPLNSIYGSTQVLCDSSMPLDDESKSMLLESIGQNTEHLTGLLNNIIVISDYDAGNVELHKAEVTAQDVIDKAMVGIMAQEGVELIIDDTRGITLHTDESQLVKALYQLLANAVKFTERGHVRVGAKAAEQEGRVTFYVEDTGRGVRAGLGEKVFERFFKEDNFVPGVGLGLPLCRAITTLLGGTVALDESYQGGARFVLTV